MTSDRALASEPRGGDERRVGKRMMRAAALACGLWASRGFADDALTPTAPPPLDSPAPYAPAPAAPALAPAVSPALAPTVAPAFAPAAPPAAAPQPAPVANNAVTTLNTFSVGNWNAYAYSLPGSQALDHCAGDASYNGGLTLGFWVDRNYQWGLYLVNSTWQLTEGQSYAVSYSIDNAYSATGQASATTTTEVSIPLQNDSSLFQRFMQGNSLKVVAAETTFSFLLTDTSQFLPALLNCVDSYVEPSETAKAANPFQALLRH